MTDTNKDNWPDKVWIENLNGAYRHVNNASLVNPESDPQDHRVMREYVLKPVVDTSKKKCLREYLEGLYIKAKDYMVIEND